MYIYFALFITLILKLTSIFYNKKNNKSVVFNHDKTYVERKCVKILVLID